MNLPVLRKQIDRTDRQLLRLLNQRARLAVRVGRVKARQRLPVLDRRREADVLRRVARANRGPLTPGAVRAIFRAILRHSRRLESGTGTD